MIDLTRQLLADCDSHVTESPDLWTSRVSAGMKERVPRVDPHPESGVERWHVGDVWMYGVASSGSAGWREYPPAFPTRWEDIEPGSYNAVARLARMDELGIHAQTLYPNLLTFATGVFVGMDPDVGIACVRAYNDFLVEFAGADPNRLVPIAMVPFWDLKASVAEMSRCAEAGHRGILFSNQFAKLGLPDFQTPYWDPIYDAAQSLGLSMNFHSGFANSPMPQDEKADIEAFGGLSPDSEEIAASVVMSMLTSNATAFTTILLSGVADRFPRLKFVSIESGVGYIPFLLDSLDWHFKGYGLQRSHDRLPSEVFRSQCYGSFWFETSTLGLLDLYPDNFLFSTDYPHPTSLVPGPASPAQTPRDHVISHFGGVPHDVAKKVLWENAATLYRLNTPIDTDLIGDR